MSHDGGMVGRQLPRVDARQKVTGKAAYAADTNLPGQLYAGVIRCPYPHARIRAVDIRGAEALDGVCAVLAASNTPGFRWYKENVPLFSDICRFAGDEIAAVAAETEELLADALAAIVVDYEEQPFVADLAAAQTADAPLVHEDKPGNRVQDTAVYERGSIQRGIAQADCVIEQTYTTQCVVHNALEPHGCTANWHDGKLTLWASTQGIHAVRKDIAKALALDDADVRVISRFMGGGFGAKQIDWKQTLIAALLARQCSRPVQLMLDRKAENLAVGNRNATHQRVRIGAAADGRLCAISAVISCDSGAYSVSGESADVSGIYELLYACSNVRTEQTNYYTNTGPSVAFRAPGFAEGAFALEQAMDELATSLELDPFELRRRNYTQRHQKKNLPYSVPDSLAECCDRVQARFRRQPDSRAVRTRKRRGFGVATCIWIGGGSNPPATARVRLHRNGNAEVFTGTQDIGTGTRTVLTQVAAEMLQCPVERLQLHLGDTAAEVYAPTSGGSTTVATMAPAVRNAAANAVRELRTACGAAADDERQFAELARELKQDYIDGSGECPPSAQDIATCTFGAQVAEVEVDTHSGEVTVVRMSIAADCGSVINPLLARSQVMGGSIQGLGYALSEERIVDDHLGLVLNANLEEYKVPTAADIPRIDHLRVDEPGVKEAGRDVRGLGEPPLIPAAPAIANALFDATGVRFRHLPITRAKLLGALSKEDRAS